MNLWKDKKQKPRKLKATVLIYVQTWGLGTDQKISEKIVILSKVPFFKFKYFYFIYKELALG